MPAIDASYYTDPSCPWSWALEPNLRRLQVEFGDRIAIRPVMGGRAARFDDPQAQVAEWLDACDRSGMPFDPRLWLEAPPSGSHPACLATIAAGEQGAALQAAYLRRLREGLMCGRRTLDGLEALVAEAHAVPGLDAVRLRRDLGSSATVERFGEQLDATRAICGREALPTIVFGERAVRGFVPYDEWRAAALAAGAEPLGEPAPGIEQALRRFGTLATAEVAAACALPGPRARAELWRLALEWKVVAERRFTSALWRLAE
ncbi:MAG: DsbA family protein [Actinobacteria bacterium]|nr:DsbA family protein [Actinomycetota bacterium]